MTDDSTLYETRHVTHDATVVRFDDDAPGVEVDADGQPSFDWDEVETVTIDNPPHAEAFDSKEFYKVPATVARPIPQPYSFGAADDAETVWLKKPREELKKAAWSLDNAPWTLGHPDTKMVKDVTDVRGFWRDPTYVDALDDLDADLHFPVGDSEAKQFLEENGDVSVGFYNRIERTDEYDGVVGGADDDGVEVEGYQTSMLFDHVASVEVGRCPSDEGCGIEVSTDGSTAQSASHGHVASADAESFKRGTRIINEDEEADEVSTDGSTAQSASTDADEGETTSIMAESTDAPSGIHVADGKWFAVGPDEHPDDSTEYADDAKFPVDSCSDITDAWNLRGSGDISIEQSTLEARIERAAEAKDCSLPEADAITDEMVAESAKNYSICGSRLETMDDQYGCTDGDCGSGAVKPDEDDNRDTFNMEIEFDDLSPKAALAKVSAQNDSVEERLDELRDAEDEAEVARDAADELDLDDVSELTDTAAMLKEQNEKLRDRIDELERPEMEADAQYIAERTDRFGEDAAEVLDNLDEDADALAEKRELVEELTEEFDEATANSGGSGEDSEEQTVDRDGKYASTPW